MLRGVDKELRKKVIMDQNNPFSFTFYKPSDQSNHSGKPI
jgi:hypothetical protein